jgi:hypothetical protein
MKHLFYTVCLFLTCTIGQAFASANNDLFIDSDIQIEEVFAPLDQLADVVASNPEADLNFVRANFSTVASSVSLMNELMIATRPLEDRAVAGISGYIWGACLGIAGVAIVYFLLDDASQAFRKSETTHAVIGCAVSTAVWTILYFTVLATAWSV